jgi:hypothetical protein
MPTLPYLPALLSTIARHCTLVWSCFHVLKRPDGRIQAKSEVPGTSSNSDANCLWRAGPKAQCFISAVVEQIDQRGAHAQDHARVPEEDQVLG